jgi:3-oxoacyl-[acyl-carrier protein] reductase
MTDRVALVTGGTRGIGRAIVSAFAEAGYRVYTCARGNSPVPESPRVTMQRCDVSSEEQVRCLFETVYAETGRLDVLVNNAGISLLKDGKRISAEEISIEQWRRTLDTNLTGAFLCSREALRLMDRQCQGAIVNIASASFRNGGILAAVDYIASKAGLIGLTRGLAYECGSRGIRVNAIVPGRISTDLIASANVPSAWAESVVPLQRLGTPDDVAGAVMFLVSQEAKYVTGATLDVSGGWTMGG